MVGLQFLMFVVWELVVWLVKLQVCCDGLIYFVRLLAVLLVCLLFRDCDDLLTDVVGHIRLLVFVGGFNDCC